MGDILSARPAAPSTNERKVPARWLYPSRGDRPCRHASACHHGRGAEAEDVATGERRTLAADATQAPCLGSQGVIPALGHMLWWAATTMSQRMSTSAGHNEEAHRKEDDGA
jgi:hypothetical protein